jgi:hypothetical protein
LDPDLLVLVALEDEASADVDDHLTTCSVCRAEVETLRKVASIGRETHEVVDLPPAPQHVWQAIAAQAFEAPTAAPAAAPVTRWWRNWRIGLVAATAALIAVAATLFLTRTPQAPQVVATAQLTVQDPAASGATGRAELLESGQLRVTLSGMPKPTGYYEVWLYDGHARMIGLGDAGSGNGSVTVSVPQTADLGEFTIVDISAQLLGQQEHGQSMLQGQLGP